uniref:NR LBD domain-containing protein n=1 Tax=Haemonchus placei TaxID=6290 RepID=A0A0N4WTF8_HAEPC
MVSGERLNRANPEQHLHSPVHTVELKNESSGNSLECAYSSSGSTVAQKRKERLVSISRYWKFSKALSKNVISAMLFGLHLKSDMVIDQITELWYYVV